MLPPSVTVACITVGIVAGLFAGATIADPPIDEFDPLSVAATQSNIDIEANFCAAAPRNQLCDILPHDVSDFSSSLVYTLIEQDAQDPFDVFSWQTFVALNRIHTSTGMLPWQSYDTPATLFNYPASICGEVEPDVLVVSDYLQSQGQPLIDQSGNFVVFDVRVNPAMADYIRDNDLNTPEGQRLFNQFGNSLDYPKGYYDSPTGRLGGQVGALAIKSAWRVLDDTDQGRYLTRPGRIAVNAESAIDGQPQCLAVTLGLVGFHVMRRTVSGNGGDWVWSTFEHDDNAPFASNARGPNSIFDTPLFEDGCSAPNISGSGSDRRFGFFDSACKHCVTNAVPAPIRAWKWHAVPPYAGRGAVPAQVTRCWRPAASTRRINEIWQLRLGDNPLANYGLSTTQWKGAPVNALFPNGEVPRYMTNTTMETFVQSEPAGTCLGCHANATDVHGNSGNYSFILTRAENRGTQAQ